MATEDEDEDEDLLDTDPDAMGQIEADGNVEEIDDEMARMLGELDNTSEDYVTEQLSPTVEGNPSPPLAVTPGPQPQSDYRETPAAETLTPQDVRRLDIKVPTITEGEAAPVQLPPDEPPIVDIRKTFEQADQAIDEIQQGARGDRQETQDAINLCRSEIDKAIAGGGNPPRMWVDNLAKILEVKATINMTAIKALELKAKLLAATKAGVVVNNTNQNVAAAASGGQDKSLVELLSNNPLDSTGDDEF